MSGTVRRAASRAAAGLPGRIASRLIRGRPAVAVLLYHRVLPDRGRDPCSLVTSEARFREQLAMVAERYPVLPLDEALRAVAGGALPARHAVALTFDDGYRDNRTRALPILREMGLPATLFLATGPAGSGEPYRWDLQAAATPAPPLGPDDLPMGFDEARSLAPVFSLGGHGHRHVSLEAAPPGVAEEDAAACAAALRREAPAHLPLFAYPFGGPDDVGPRAEEAVRRAGFAAAFTAMSGVVRRGAPPFRLPRLAVGEESAGSLAVRLMRAFAARG